jgi:sugar lactone lactonase YvrE
MINSIHLSRNINRLYHYKVFQSVSLSIPIYLILIVLEWGTGGSPNFVFGQTQNYTFLMALDPQNSGEDSNQGDNSINIDPLPQPEGIDVDSDGNVLVNDIGHNQINLFDNTGKLIDTWGSSTDSPGQFNHPHGNENDDDKIRGNNTSNQQASVYIVDQNNNRIQKFTTNGTFVSMWGEEGEGDGQFLHPHGIDLDFEGNIYVSDRDQPSIQKFSSDGTFIKKWGSQGTFEGQFIQPWDVAVSSDNRIFVPDHGNDRVQIFSPDGEFITSWGSSGTGPNQFDGPAVVAFDFDGNVYVTDSGNQRVQKFSSDGTFITEWGEEGEGKGQFSMPEGLAIDSVSGKVYVSDTSNNNVQVFVPLPK